MGQTISSVKDVLGFQQTICFECAPYCQDYISNFEVGQCIHLFADEEAGEYRITSNPVIDNGHICFNVFTFGKKKLKVGDVISGNSHVCAIKKVDIKNMKEVQ
jgi:hypothetical protein